MWDNTLNRNAVDVSKGGHARKGATEVFSSTKLTLEAVKVFQRLLLPLLNQTS